PPPSLPTRRSSDLPVMAPTVTPRASATTADRAALAASLTSATMAFLSSSLIATGFTPGCYRFIRSKPDGFWCLIRYESGAPLRRPGEASFSGLRLAQPTVWDSPRQTGTTICTAPTSGEVLSYASNEACSTPSPGPMGGLTATTLTYIPLAVDGFRHTRSDSSASTVWLS